MSETVSQAGVGRWLTAFARAVAASREQLTQLDAAIGDADHGVNMDRGMQAVVAKLGAAEAGDAGAVLKLAAMTLISTVGGAAGPLYGTFFLEMAKAVGPAASVTPAEWAAALDAGVRGVRARGKAEPGDKTMVDTLEPATRAFGEAVADGQELRSALGRAAEAAERGMKATTPLVARKGRASYLGERSAGHQDPGATSSWMLLRAAAQALPEPDGAAGTGPAGLTEPAAETGPAVASTQPAAETGPARRSSGPATESEGSTDPAPGPAAATS